MYLKKSVKTKVNKHSFEKIFWKNSKESRSKKKPRKSTYKIHLKRTHQKSKQRSLENKSQERILLTHKKSYLRLGLLLFELLWSSSSSSMEALFLTFLDLCTLPFCFIFFLTYTHESLRFTMQIQHWRTCHKNSGQSRQFWSGTPHVIHFPFGSM